jgi:hypothetical protein
MAFYMISGNPCQCIYLFIDLSVVDYRYNSDARRYAKTSATRFHTRLMNSIHATFYDNNVDNTAHWITEQRLPRRSAKNRPRVPPTFFAIVGNRLQVRSRTYHGTSTETSTSILLATTT